MQTWQKYLKGDPRSWLLERENPSIRYWTLIDILDRPESDPEVQDARSAIPQQALVKELFALQHPEGYWGEDETKPHTAQGTLTALTLLHRLGVVPCERIAAGCDSFLKNCQHECGGFSMTKRLRSGIFPCTTGEHLSFLVYFGMGDDPRLRAAFAFLIQAMAGDDALDCGRYAHRDCLWGAIAALNGLAVLPAGLRSAQSERVVKRLADALLEAPYDFEGRAQTLVYFRRTAWVGPAQRSESPGGAWLRPRRPLYGFAQAGHRSPKRPGALVVRFRLAHLANRETQPAE